MAKTLKCSTSKPPEIECNNTKPSTCLNPAGFRFASPNLLVPLHQTNPILSLNIKEILI
jgi:hypothetical protein